MRWTRLNNALSTIPSNAPSIRFHSSGGFATVIPRSRREVRFQTMFPMYFSFCSITATCIRVRAGPPAGPRPSASKREIACGPHPAAACLNTQVTVATSSGGPGTSRILSEVANFCSPGAMTPRGLPCLSKSSLRYPTMLSPP